MVLLLRWQLTKSTVRHHMTQFLFSLSICSHTHTHMKASIGFIYPQYPSPTLTDYKLTSFLIFHFCRGSEMLEMCFLLDCESLFSLITFGDILPLAIMKEIIALQIYCIGEKSFPKQEIGVGCKEGHANSLHVHHRHQHDLPLNIGQIQLVSGGGTFSFQKAFDWTKLVIAG